MNGAIPEETNCDTKKRHDIPKEGDSSRSLIDSQLRVKSNKQHIFTKTRAHIVDKFV